MKKKRTKPCLKSESCLCDIINGVSVFNYKLLFYVGRSELMVECMDLSATGLLLFSQWWHFQYYYIDVIYDPFNCLQKLKQRIL